ncbi:MAG: NADPH-dependent FMN reductase [Alphaproteobacteria bacterium]|nr:NADPH-dependent FMN reductase [Alphaproteobacteria bacterium]
MTAIAPVHILAIAGSLRAQSLNKAALRAAIAGAPTGVSISEAEIGDLPLYNQDIQAAGFPEAVIRLGRQIVAADAILFVTPEYNYSVPGVLKNAIDWISRLPDQPFAGKPAAIIGVSPGNLGTARAQYHLRQIGVFLDLHFLNKPEVMIGQATAKFDDDGRLTDEDTLGRIEALLGALVDWTRRLAQPSGAAQADAGGPGAAT